MGRAFAAITETGKELGFTETHPLIEALRRLDDGGSGSAGDPFIRVIPVTVEDCVPYAGITTDPHTMNVFDLTGTDDMVVNTPTTPVNSDTFTVKGDSTNALRIVGTNGHTIDGAAFYDMPAGLIGGSHQQAVTLAFDSASAEWKIVWFYKHAPVNPG